METKAQKKIILKGRSVGFSTEFAANNVDQTNPSAMIPKIKVSQMEEHVHSEGCSHDHEEVSDAKRELAEAMISARSGSKPGWVEAAEAPKTYQGIAQKALSKDDKRKARNRRKAKKHSKPRPQETTFGRRRSLLRTFVALSKRVATAQKRLETTKADFAITTDDTTVIAVGLPRYKRYQRLLNKHMSRFTTVLGLMQKDSADVQAK